MPTPITTPQLCAIICTSVYMAAVAVLAIGGIIIQSVHCDTTHNQCNLTRMDDYYEWYPTQSLNKSTEAQFDCRYYGKSRIPNNTWKLIPCYIDLSEVREDPRDAVYICPNGRCTLNNVSESLFGAARWLFIIGLAMFGLILIAILGYRGYFWLWDCWQRRREARGDYSIVAVHVEDF